MSERVSNRAIELRVEWLNKALGRQLVPWVPRDDGKGFKATNAFYVDHQLGGYRLESNGQPTFGQYRMTKNELCNQLEAILTAIRLARNEDTGSAWPKAMESQAA